MSELENEVKPFWIGIQGGSCAGKTELSNALALKLDQASTLVLELDNFYLPFDRVKQELDPVLYNFDHPLAIDWELAREVSRNLNSSISVEIPQYDYITGYRRPGVIVEPRNYIIVNGLWPFYDNSLLQLFNLRVFIDTAPDIRLVRRLYRDLLNGSRGWPFDNALSYYIQCSRPMHFEFVEPGKAISHIVIDGEIPIADQVNQILQELLNDTAGL